MIHSNKDKIITNLFYALISRPAWYTYHALVWYSSRHWRRFSIAVDAHIRRRVLDPLTILLFLHVAMVVCPSQNQPQDQPHEGQPKEAISITNPQKGEVHYLWSVWYVKLRVD